MALLHIKVSWHFSIFSTFQLKLTWSLATFIFIILVIVLAPLLWHHRNYMHLKNAANYHWTSHFLHGMSLIFSSQYLWPICMIAPSITEMWHVLYIFSFLSSVSHYIFTSWIKEILQCWVFFVRLLVFVFVLFCFFVVCFYRFNIKSVQMEIFKRTEFCIQVCLCIWNASIFHVLSPWAECKDLCLLSSWKFIILSIF